MNDLRKWAKAGTQYMYDVNAVEAFEAGAIDMRNRIHELIRLTDSINTDNIKADPILTSFILLELADKVKTFGE